METEFKYFFSKPHWVDRYMAHRAFSLTLGLMIIVSCFSHFYIIGTLGKDATNLFLPDLVFFINNDLANLILHCLLFMMLSVFVIFSICFLAAIFTLMGFNLFYLLLSIKKQIFKG